MGVWVIIIYLTLLISTLLIGSVSNHKIIKKYTKDIIHNDCYYLNPNDFEHHLRLDKRMRKSEGKSDDAIDKRNSTDLNLIVDKER